MRERDLAGLVVFAFDRYSPAMYYVTGQKLHFAMYFRGVDGRAHLIHDHMERDQAEAVGCDHSTFAQHRVQDVLEREGHPARAYGRMIAEMCATMGMTGRIALFGDLTAGFAGEMIRRMQEIEPRIELDASYPDILSLARATKEADEVRAIRKAAQGTVVALTHVREMLGALKRQGDAFVHDGGEAVTLGTIRRAIRRVFLDQGLAEDGDSIVSQGRDAGVPHNPGNDAQPLRPGTPVIIDIFPGEAGGGYHSDVTRTFCVGKASDDLKRVYDDVHDAFRLAVSKLTVGAPCRQFQELVSDLFERRGHPTQCSHQGTEEGYVHGLGHGVGLSVHEYPRLAGPPSNTSVLEPGMVVTVEPGLYYPSRDLGVRIEDLLLVRADGTIENLSPVPYDLEIPSRS
jgi:Xaa-Pro aminopeptidase